MATLIARLTGGKPLNFDWAWIAVLIILAAIALFSRAQFSQSIAFTLTALASTAPYILFAVLMIAFLKAAGAEAVVAHAFEGRETKMIILAALLGGLAPFCSCEVIPFIAGLLAVGAPLSAVMAFWLSSPLIDPPSLLITAGALGWHFAVSKAVLAVAVGLAGGFAMRAAVGLGWFASPLRERDAGGCGCGPSLATERPLWRFWPERDRRVIFRREALVNIHFLLKWLTLAYLLESLMIAYIPAETIVGLVGGEGVLPIVVSAVIGAPAYLNGYAAPPLVAGLVEQGMSQGAAMAFMVAGAVSSIPAMTAVFALVKRPVFAAYITLGMSGAILSGLAYGLAVIL